MEVTDLVKKMVAIPSYYDARHNESVYARFLESTLKKMPAVKHIERQYVVASRFNLFVHDGSPVQLLFACHLDTTPPKQGGHYDPLKPVVVGNRLYGLGAKDMKGGIACLLKAVEGFKSTRGLGMLFYVDEENRLLGMRRFVEGFKFSYPFRPRLILSPESRFAIGHANRGIIGIRCIVRGKTAHSARPEKGINAIVAVMRAYETMRNRVKEMIHLELGRSVANLSYLHGGFLEEKPGAMLKIGRRMNIVPDIVEADVSVRTAQPKLDAAFLIREMRRNIRKEGAILEKAEVLYDFRAAYNPRHALRPLIRAIKNAGLRIKWGSARKSGYNDVALLAEKYGVPYANFGPDGSNNHAADEYVEIKTLEPTRSVFQELIRICCNGS